MTLIHPNLWPVEAEAVIARRLAEITPPAPPERQPGVRPLVVIIGGQPAAGKTTTQEYLQAALGADRTAVYDMDDNLAAHPRYDAIMRAEGTNGSRVIRQHLPRDLGGRCLDHLRTAEPQPDVIVSTPLQFQDTAKALADNFRDSGHRVAVVYVATSDADSLLSLANRYQQARDDTGIGRWESASGHGQSYHGVLDVAHALESEAYVDDIYVVNRDGYVLFENHRGSDGTMAHPPGARDAMVAERNRPPTPAERERFLSTADALRRRGPGQPALAPLINITVMDAMARYARRGEAQDRTGEPPPGSRLDQRLADLRRIAGSGVAPAHSIHPPSGRSSQPPMTHGSTGSRPGRSTDGGWRDR